MKWILYLVHIGLHLETIARHLIKKLNSRHVHCGDAPFLVMWYASPWMLIICLPGRLFCSRKSIILSQYLWDVAPFQYWGSCEFGGSSVLFLPHRPAVSLGPEEEGCQRAWAGCLCWRRFTFLLPSANLHGPTLTFHFTGKDTEPSSGKQFAQYGQPGSASWSTLVSRSSF